MKIPPFDPFIPHFNSGKNKSENFRKRDAVPLDSIEISHRGDPETPRGDKRSVPGPVGRDKNRIDLTKSQAVKGPVEGDNKTGKLRNMIHLIGVVMGLTDRNGICSFSNSISPKGAGQSGRAEKLAQVREKIADGYYDDPRHMEELAEAIIRKLMLE